MVGFLEKVVSALGVSLIRTVKVRVKVLAMVALVRENPTAVLVTIPIIHQVSVPGPLVREDPTAVLVTIPIIPQVSVPGPLLATITARPPSTMAFTLATEAYPGLIPSRQLLNHTGASFLQVIVPLMLGKNLALGNLSDV